jgi:protocatechuate 3,4-dioxygenase, beta subunit
MKHRVPLAALVILVALASAPSAEAQDRDFVRAYERAQASRPATIGSVSRIAPESEPGTPLVIDGRVYLADGRSPAGPGITVFAYHTDRHGLYDEPSAGPHSWRLKGWAVTDAEGRFTFHTIRPASYPNAAVPQHVHLHLEGPNLPRRWTTELEFDDDPKMTARGREKSKRAGMFGGVRPVTTRDGVDYVEINLRIENRGMF